MTYSEFNLSTIIADTFPDPIAVLDTKGTILWCNSATYEMTGQSPDEILGNRFTKLTTLRARDVPGYVKLFATLLAGKKVDPIEVTWKTKDGSEQQAEARISLIETSEGKKAVQVITRNLTEVRNLGAKLEESERKLRDFFHNSQVPLFRTDLETGLVLDCNIVGASLFGYSDPGDLNGKVKVSEHYINTNARDELIEIIAKDGKVRNYLLHLRKVNGEKCWVELSSTVYPDEGYLESVVVDITDRKQAEEQLRKSEKMFRNIVEHSSDILFNLDGKGQIIYTSPQVEKVLGYEKGEMKGPWVDYTSDDPVNKTGIKITEHTYRTGEKPDRFVIQLLHKNGQGRYLEVDMSPEINDKGTVIGLVGIVRHVTKEYEAEIALRASEERYRSLLEHIPDVVWTTDRDGKTVYISPNVMDIYGFTQEEIYEGGNSVWFARIHPDDVEQLNLQYEELFTNGNAMEITYRIQRKDGKWIWIHDRSYGTYEENGQVLATGVFSDITQQKQMEIQIAESAEKFRSIFDESSIANNLYDADGILIDANQAGIEMFGVTRVEDLLGFKLFDDPNLPKDIARRLRAGETQRFLSEFSFDRVKKDNLYPTSKSGIHYFECVIVPLGISDTGKINGYLVQLIDLTESKKTEKALKASHQRYQELWDNLPAGVGITDFDECLTMANSEYCRIFGYEPDEIIGMNVLDTIAPEDHETILTQTESRKYGQSSAYEIQIVRKDGSLRSVRLSAVPHRNDIGEIIGTIGLIIDISDAKRAEEAIQASENRLRNLIEQLPLGVAIADLSERVELVNQTLAEMLWQERSKLVGHELTDYLSPAYVEKVKEETMTRKTGAKSTYDVEMIRTDGIKRDIRVVAAPNFDSSGKVIGSVGIFEDITDEKQNIIIRAQQEQEIDLYGSLLRHDLRNDLGLILSYIEAVQMLMVNPNEEVESFLKSAIASVERMAELLKNFGRPQDVRKVDIVEFIQEIADETQEAEKGLKIEVGYRTGTKPVTVTAGSLLALVFMNLFRNSAQHAGDEPQIDVKVSMTGSRLEIIVSDNGPGVSKEFQERLFARGTSSKGEAGGLGLYLCKEIMERTGGSIELLKEKKGATFRLFLQSKG